MISKHITLSEATNSPTALRLKIKNEPNPTQLEAMKVVANMLFEPLREWYGKPIKINSFFRCEELNKSVGGSKTSQHCKGEAIDMSAGSKEENKKLFDWCKANLIFDQLINEYDYTWVHISYKVGMNRNQTLEVK
jgi:zinc D-Ala-D-Ala carboxypeptidase